MCDVAREAEIACRSRLYRFAKGDPHCQLGPVPLARISRFLVKVEYGLAIKREGKIAYLDVPTRKPDHFGHVVFTSRCPRLVLGTPPPAPAPRLHMPAWFKDFKFPNV